MLLTVCFPDRDKEKEKDEKDKPDPLVWVRRSKRPSQWDQMIASAEVMVPNPVMSGINPQIQSTCSLLVSF